MGIQVNHIKFITILLDKDDPERIEAISNNFKCSDSLEFTLIEKVDEDKIYAEFKSVMTSNDIIDFITSKYDFKGVVNVSEADVFMGQKTTSSLIKGKPNASLGIVIFNDSKKDYSSIIHSILNARNCVDISIEDCISTHKRKYYVVKFTVQFIDFYELKTVLHKEIHEEMEFCENIRNQNYYNEILIDNGNWWPPIPIHYKIIELKRNNYYDVSGDDISMNPDFW